MNFPRRASKPSDFQKSLIDSSLELSKKYGQTDQLFGVPLDIHTLVLYYNKTALQKADLLDADGKPKGLDGIEAFTKMLTAVKDKARLTPIAVESAAAGPAWNVARLVSRCSNSRKGISLKAASCPSRTCQTKAANPFRSLRTWLNKDCIRRTPRIPRW